MRRGITLIELLVSLAISAMMIVALSMAFSAAVRYDRTSVSVGEREAAIVQFENALRSRLELAYVSEDSEETNSYFIGRSQGNEGGLGEDVQATEIVFTMAGKKVSAAAVANEELDFELRNESLGTVGGITEVSISQNPVGDPGDMSGLFLREQTPSDEDPDQGGFESLLAAEVTGIGFEFFDGTDWAPTWDTTTSDRRLPAAVRVTYSLSDEESSRILVVRLANSDVTPQNPFTAVQGGTTP
ncbi:MAG TPA: type II secretion system protein GspJ [Fimbriimonadaceae bacterium]|nr:type II secretion system protein GspJ [Fimbriimonadaceae bacterium]